MCTYANIHRAMLQAWNNHGSRQHSDGQGVVATSLLALMIPAMNL